MARIAILAFGSLIEDPGEELGPRIRDRVEGVKTPFSIEFARSSGSRGGGPTLVPVDDGGSPVNAVLLELDPAVGVAEAQDLLWKRETRKESAGQRYVRPANPGQNHVIVECIEDFHGFDVVLYTKIGANIEPLTADCIAELAISSARGDAGADKKDGISYLASAIRQGITTPLQPGYKAAILRKTEAGDLDEAHTRIRERRASPDFRNWRPKTHVTR